jgi:hypothetical protein
MLQAGAITTGAGENLMITGRIPFNTGALGSELYDFSSLKTGARLDDAMGNNLQTPVKNQHVKFLLLDRPGIYAWACPAMDYINIGLAATGSSPFFQF